MKPLLLHHITIATIFLLLLTIMPTSSLPTQSSHSLKLSSEDIDGSSSPLITFLERLQETALATFGPSNFDPKFYVDLSLKLNLSLTESAFNNLPGSRNGSVSPLDLNSFIDSYLADAGDDLMYIEPADFVPHPNGFLPLVQKPEIRAWALKIHSLWKNLSRQVSPQVARRPDLHTLLPLPEPVIIPGSRFREVYYWDSYWVIRGLLSSKMFDTAKAIVRNLIYLVNKYSFVLNGARAYYTNRSQPPLLSSMVYDIYNRTGDTKLVKEALPALLKEHRFWNSGVHKVVIQDPQGDSHSLSRYYAMWDKPRPESATIDKKSASKFTSDSEKRQFYRELASTAETGWDFSTRWMRDPPDFTTLATTSIIPVDLNAILLKMELDITFMANIIEENNIADLFLEASAARKRAINSIFWNESSGQWLDYWLTNSTTSTQQDVEFWKAENQNCKTYASNFLPIWISSFNSDDSVVEKVVISLRDSSLLRDAGIATSLENSGQQWDSPNGWAPIQHMIIEGLARSGSEEAKALGQDIAMRWIRTNYATFRKDGKMHEKYDVFECGKTGGGGEYEEHTGFGWSNGVVLALLEDFGWPCTWEIDCLQQTYLDRGRKWGNPI